MAVFNFKNNKFLPLFLLDTIYPLAWRRIVEAITTLGTIISGLAVLIIYSAAYLQLPLFAPPLPFLPGRILGILFIFLSLRLSVFSLKRYRNSFLFNPAGDPRSENIAQRFSLAASHLWHQASIKDDARPLDALIQALPLTENGASLLIRLGIAPKEITLAAAKPGVPEEPLHESPPLDMHDPVAGITLGDLTTLMFSRHSAFRDLLRSKDIDGDSLRAASEWIEKTSNASHINRQWWRRDRLARVQGLAKTWAYGPIFTLLGLGEDLRHEALTLPFELIGREREIKLLEAALLKQSGANAIIVGDPGTGKEQMLLGFIRMIVKGQIFPALEYKRVIKISGPSVIAAAKTKGEIEALLIKALNEAVRAGDVILTIEDFPEFVQSLGKLGVIASQLLDPYLASPQINIIALANTASFRRSVESDASLMKLFEKIHLTELDKTQLLEILMDIVTVLEQRSPTRTMVTYQALEKIAEGGIRYVVSGALPERAIDLLEEIIADASSSKQAVITSEMVADFLEKKTNIPMGAIGEEEQRLLLNLEEKLHERVIDQEEAIRAIADAVRRSRAGIVEPKKPIGSFLFLGPTGVGKTETAKTLAAAYFKSEDAMVRFDMTEYQSAEALLRLIGSFTTGEPGILASRMRTSPYAVVLLDEFEKADGNVIDLFLQILDEGYFSDAFGTRVNMRNTIIIATSNAGARLIWEMVGHGINPNDKKSDIINVIQQEGKFKPELLNRFDAIIIFQPLSQKDLRKVARLMLVNLADRLVETQEIILDITDELVNEAVKQGYDPAFGARPMRRFIQEKVEKVIAEKIIKGELKRGMTISLTAADVA